MAKKQAQEKEAKIQIFRVDFKTNFFVIFRKLWRSCKIYLLGLTFLTPKELNG